MVKVINHADDIHLAFSIIEWYRPLLCQDPFLCFHRTLQRLHRALDELADDPRKAVLHLPREQPANPALADSAGQDDGAIGQPLPDAASR